MIRKTILVSIGSIFLLTILSCSIDYKEANDKAVEKLNAQVKAEKFEEIYNNSSEITRSTISKSEFVERMKKAVEKMKEVDKTLNWQKIESEENFYKDNPVSETSVRKLAKNGKTIGIFIYWANYFTLCGFEISSVDTDSEVRVVQACS